MIDAFVFDIDGTLALKGDRPPYDWDRVGEDKPNEPVVAVARALLYDGRPIVYVSGRSEVCREATENWLHEHVHKSAVDWGYEYLIAGLHMRPDGDYRPDTDLKREIYETEIKANFNVLGVFDDRRSVVRMWRSLGLPVFDVADGDF